MPLPMQGSRRTCVPTIRVEAASNPREEPPVDMPDQLGRMDKMIFFVESRGSIAA